MKQWISRIKLRRALPGLFALAVLLFFAHQVTAQEGTILGTVSDPSGRCSFERQHQASPTLIQA